MWKRGSSGEVVKMKKTMPILKRNDQGMDGWNLYWNGNLKKLTIYPEAETIYFEIEADRDE